MTEKITYKTVIIVPAFNESLNIVNAIESLKFENQDWDIIVINDGSDDNTGELAESTGKAYVVNLPCNLGIGGAVQTGFKFAENMGYEIAVKFDGDGQHKASEIKKLLKPILNDNADVAIGSRFYKNNNGYQSTFTRRIGIYIFKIVNSLIIQQKITDNTSGFRAYNKKSIAFLSRHYPSGYPEPEEVILLGRNGFIISEVDVEMQERQGGESSISGIKSIYYMIKVLLAIFMNLLRSKII